MDETRMIGIRLSVTSEVELTEIALRFRTVPVSRTRRHVRENHCICENVRKRECYIDPVRAKSTYLPQP